MKNFKIKNNKGIATLPAVMVIGMMALAVVVGITSMAFNELLISEGASQSSNALFYAEAGGRDALTRIARNKIYSGSYSLDFVANECWPKDNYFQRDNEVEHSPDTGECHTR